MPEAKQFQSSTVVHKAYCVTFPALSHYVTQVVGSCIFYTWKCLCVLTNYSTARLSLNYVLHVFNFSCIECAQHRGQQHLMSIIFLETKSNVSTAWWRWSCILFNLRKVLQISFPEEYWWTSWIFSAMKSFDFNLDWDCVCFKFQVHVIN